MTTTGATGIAAPDGLPDGVTASWTANTITISGTPTVAGTFEYWIPLTGGCSDIRAWGIITVTPIMSVGDASDTPTLCINTEYSPAITHTTSGVTGVGTPTGLPAGVTASYASNTITISGTPTVTGTFNYTIPLTGCGTANATGTITVISSMTATTPAPSRVCFNTALSPNITITTTGATGIGTATGLPAGVTASWASNTITISGTPTDSGTFNYTIPLTGDCGTVNATGTITVAGNLACWNGTPCGAFVATGVWKAFMCRNLGAEIADPFTPSAALNGDYYQWGSPTPAATRDGIIGTWSSAIPAGFYGDGTSTSTDAKVKSTHDPCPPGYRVPSYAEWQGVFNTSLNPRSNSGIWNENQWSGARFGNLFLPTPGYRRDVNGESRSRGTRADYWTNRMWPGGFAYFAGIYSSDTDMGSNDPRSYGYSVRCIAE